MREQNHELEKLLQEMLIPASNELRANRFDSVNSAAANCSGKCDGGGCRAMIEHE